MTLRLWPSATFLGYLSRAVGSTLAPRVSTSFCHWKNILHLSSCCSSSGEWRRSALWMRRRRRLVHVVGGRRIFSPVQGS